MTKSSSIHRERKGSWNLLGRKKERFRLDYHRQKKNFQFFFNEEIFNFPPIRKKIFGKKSYLKNE